jgi:hypothetical protein
MEQMNMGSMSRGKSQALNYGKHNKLSSEQLEQISQDSPASVKRINEQEGY